MTTNLSIPEFYAGKDVFITGGTGFIGKILVEKLLRSCSGVGNIYLLVRPRRNVTPEERLKEYCNHEIFNLLKTQYPDACDKLKLVRGDVAETGLGLSPQDRQLLQERVSIIFHVAASIRFDESLHKAILCNVRSTREVVDLALGMNNLKLLVHVSTAYSNSDQFDIEEKILPAHGDWRTFIKVAETLDRFTVDIITKKLLGKMPNTYVFTKSLAEHIINDHRHLLPVVVIRPSVVVGVSRDPLKGYTDNLYGPTGLVVAVGKGMLRAVWGREDSTLDSVPADIVVKATIIAGWKRVVMPPPDGIEVYNISDNGVLNCTQKQVKEHGLAANQIIPFTPLYYPMIFYIPNKMLYLLVTYSTQLSVAILLDLFLRILRRKPMLVKLQRRLYNAVHAMHYFMTYRWKFHNERFLRLEEELLDCDIRDFQYHFKGLEVFNYYTAASTAIRYTLVKETLTVEQSKMIYTGWFLWHCFMCSTAVWLALWACYAYSIPEKLLSVLLSVLHVLLIL